MNMSTNVISHASTIEARVHPTAIIDPLAQIHPSVVIGPYCLIEGPVIIDAGTVLHHHVHITGPTTIGQGNAIYSFASIGCDPQDKKHRGEVTSLVIGDHNVIREYTTLSRGTLHGGGVTRIGSHNLLMAYVHVAHDCMIGDHNVLANNASLAGHVEVGSYVGLGGFAAAHQFCRVGSYAFAGGGSILTKDLPPYTLCSGYPVRLVGLNLEGLKRRGFSEIDRKILKESFRTLFKHSSNIIETAQDLLAQCDPEDKLLKPLLEFILNSPRGLIR